MFRINQFKYLCRWLQTPNRCRMGICCQRAWEVIFISQWQNILNPAEVNVLSGHDIDSYFYGKLNVNTASNSKDTINFSTSGIFRNKTIPVGSINSKNKLGIYDMTGNVSEWC